METKVEVTLATTPATSPEERNSISSHTSLQPDFPIVEFVRFWRRVEIRGRSMITITQTILQVALASFLCLWCRGETSVSKPSFVFAVWILPTSSSEEIPVTNAWTSQGGQGTPALSVTVRVTSGPAPDTGTTTPTSSRSLRLRSRTSMVCSSAISLECCLVLSHRERRVAQNLHPQTP